MTNITSSDNMHMKSIRWQRNSLESIRAFSAEARRAAGYQLGRVQEAREPEDWKPMPSVGIGVNEIRIREENGAFRVIYVAKFPEAVYVLHAFQKKARKTSKQDIELARQRFRELIQERKQR